MKNANNKFFYFDLLNILKNKPNKFWEIIHPKEHKSIHLNNINGIPASDSESASLINTYFSSVFTLENNDNIPLLSHLSHSDMPSIEITYLGIVKVIENLKTSASSGDDQINSKLLKNTKHISSPILSLIFQQSLMSASFRLTGKLVEVSLFLKVGIVMLYRTIAQYLSPASDVNY